MTTFNDISTEFIASVTTGVLIFLGRWGWRSWGDFRIQKKYPLAGDYISYYVDFNEDNKEFTSKAYLNISQNGRSFTSTNTNLKDRREWDLRGSILPHGYLAGTYGRLDPNDPSKGTFFMEPDVSKPGCYTGHWSGYDSINRRLATGKYDWRRICKVRIRELTKKDIFLVDQILAIFAESLGDRFIARDKIEDILNKAPNKFILGGFMGKQLVAVRTIYILSAEESTTFQEVCRKCKSNLNLSHYKVGMLASNAVRSHHRRKGIGSQMVEAGLKMLRIKGCTICVATAWESGSVESSAKLLEAFGFTHIATSENHWSHESLNNGYDCPKCGSPPCSCSARFYTKQIES